MYNSIKDLPTTTKNLPYNGKRIFLKFFNRTYRKSKSEAASSKAAWRAVKRKYIKNRYGDWAARADANDYDTTTTDTSFDSSTDFDDTDDDDGIDNE